jgi:hypothetical protein
MGGGKRTVVDVGDVAGQVSIQDLDNDTARPRLGSWDTFNSWR